MKYLILFLLSINANAGVAQLNWQHDGMHVDGVRRGITEFRVYWYYENMEPYSTRIDVGLPPFWKVEGYMKFWTQTFTDDVKWKNGDKICFKMTALDGAAESIKTNPVCKIMEIDPNDPNAPVLIDITM